MPQWAARLWLRVEKVRCEKLGDISDGDVAAEGCDWNEPFGTDHGWGNSPAQRAYCRHWTSLHGTWNPALWCWVYDFKRIDKPKE